MFKPASQNASARSLKLAPRREAPVAEDDRLPRVCIIGAGSSGIAVAKTLYEAGVPFDCFEKSDRVGGHWVFQNKNGLSAAYRSLHANTSRDRTAYSDFPLPADWPDFPHHSQLAAYFEAYVDWFGFKHRIQFNRSVERVLRREDGVWQATLDGGETRLYDYVCVASGQFWNPAWPDPRPPGQFDGVEIHAKDYIDPAQPSNLRGKRALVVGFGNSAVDIACELGRKENCEMVYLSTRRGRWVIPRHFGARVWDAYYQHPAVETQKTSLNLRAMLRGLAPRKLREWVRLRRLESSIGLPHQHGLLQPEEPYFTCQPTISSEFYQRVAAGDVAVKPDVADFHGRQVKFEDGSTVEVDAIIWCTGYVRTFPFFEERLSKRAQDSTSLWMQLVDPEQPNLFFIGFIYPGCASMPMAEQQAIFFRDVLLGRSALPSARSMQDELTELDQRKGKGASLPKWYAHHLDCTAYVAALRRVSQEGRARAPNRRVGDRRAASPRPPEVATDASAAVS